MGKKLTAKQNEEKVNELAKKKASPKNVIELYERSLEKTMSTNLRLQAKALERVDEMIGELNAVQAATVYGILFDKAHTAVGANQVKGDNTFNMYFGGSADTMSVDAAAELMTKVLNRVKNADKASGAVDVDGEEAAEERRSILKSEGE